MAVDNVNGSGSVSGVQSQSGASAVTSTLYGEVVTELDQQIKDFNKELETTNAEKQELRETKYSFNTTSDKITETVNDKSVACVDISPADYKVMCDIAIANGAQSSIPTSGIALEGGTVYRFSKEVFDGFCTTVNDKMDGKLTDLNSMSELKMVKFQALMDSRKQAMAMLTNTMQSQSQMNQQIIGNMKS